MHKKLRHMIINHLWDAYRLVTPQMQLIEKRLALKNNKPLTLDHFAIIDLPGSHTGIPTLSQLFSAIGYIEQGRDYLPDKQNDFLWMAESDSLHLTALEALPQVVVADFRLDELPPPIRKIITHYGEKSPPSPLPTIQKLINDGGHDAMIQANNLMTSYLSGRDWPLPTMNEFHTVQEFNELLAWVLVFGRRPNHFTLSVHLLDCFPTLAAFHAFLEEELQMQLNHENGAIKGGPHTGIEQGSTEGIRQQIKLADGHVEIPTGFVEFVWRYPKKPSPIKPVLWNDFFTGFIAQHANNVIESLYINEPARPKCLRTHHEQSDYLSPP